MPPIFDVLELFITSTSLSPIIFHPCAMYDNRYKKCIIQIFSQDFIYRSCTCHSKDSRNTHTISVIFIFYFVNWMKWMRNVCLAFAYVTVDFVFFLGKIQTYSSKIVSFIGQNNNVNDPRPYWQLNKWQNIYKWREIIQCWKLNGWRKIMKRCM